MNNQATVFRKTIFWLHLITGIVFGLVILTMATTGMIMAFDKQIVEFSERDVRRVSLPASGTHIFSLQELAVQASLAKEGSEVTGINVFADPLSAPYFSFGEGKGVLFMNPYTGEALGSTSKTHDFLHWIEDLHRRLAVRGKGEYVTALANVAFFFLLIGGVYLWWPKNWTLKGLKAVTLFNPSAKGRARDWNWHNVIGFWCAPVLLATTLTGMIMSYTWANDLLFRMTGNEPPARRSQGMTKPAAVNQSAEVREKKAVQPKASQAGFDQLFKSATSQVPDWISMNIRMASSGRGSAPDAVMVHVIEKNAPHRFARSQLKLHAETAVVIGCVPFKQQNLGQQFRAWVRPIHTGEAWGLGGQILAFIGALGATLLVWTGLAMVWYRFFSTDGTRLRYERTLKKKDDALI